MLVGSTGESTDVAVRHKSKQGILLLSFMSSHLDRVTDDYFSRDPVGDTVSMSEQLLEGAFRQEALTGRRTAAPCWRRRVPAGGASRTQTGSYRIYVEGQSPGRHGGEREKGPRARAGIRFSFTGLQNFNSVG